MTKETLRQHYKTLRASLGTKAVADQSLVDQERFKYLEFYKVKFREQIVNLSYCSLNMNSI